MDYHLGCTPAFGKTSCVWQYTQILVANGGYFCADKKIERFGKESYKILEELLSANGTPIGMALPKGNYPWNEQNESAEK